jgi:predicted nucleic acid-binding Zn ribbon protein
MVLKQLKKIPLYKETINHMDSIIDYQEKNIEYRDSIRAINSDHENSLNSKLNECNQEYIKQNKQLKKKSRISNYKIIALLILITILVLR